MIPQGFEMPCHVFCTSTQIWTVRPLRNTPNLAEVSICVKPLRNVVYEYSVQEDAHTMFPYIANTRHNEHWLTIFFEPCLETAQPNKGQSINGECSLCRGLAM